MWAKILSPALIAAIASLPSTLANPWALPQSNAQISGSSSSGSSSSGSSSSGVSSRGLFSSNSTSSPSNSTASFSLSSSSSSSHVVSFTTSTIPSSSGSVTLSSILTPSSTSPPSLSTSATGGVSASGPITSHIAVSSSLPFIVPTNTDTVDFSIKFPSPSSSTTAGGFFATNPADPSETIGFITAKVPSDDRDNLPDVTDVAPAALLLLDFKLPVLLFPSFAIIAPFGTEAALTAAAAWLTLDLYPDPDEIDDDDDSHHSSRAGSSSAPPSSVSSSEVSSSSSSSAAPAATSLYLIVTKDGTSSSDFQALINDFPDEGKGYQIVYPNLNYQGYVTSINDSFAAQVAENSIVQLVALDDPLDDPDDGGEPSIERRSIVPGWSVPRHDAPELRKRAVPPPPTNNLVRQAGSQTALKILSQGKANNIGGILEDYLFDNTAAGDGITIYVIDTGFLQGAQDFNFDSSASNWVEGEDYYLVPPALLNENHLSGNVNNQRSLKETINHGTCVASMAVGTTWGVAKNARLVPVKFKNEGGARPAAIQDAFSWVINDVIEKDREGKAIINLSSGFDPTGGAFGISDALMTNLLNEAWAEGIVTVVAAGNEGPHGTTDRTTPQRLGTPNNPLITVGGIFDDGSIWDQSTRQGTLGSITVSLLSFDITCQDFQNVGGSQQANGTSFASPQVAGLAAYFMSIPSLYQQFSANGARGVPQAVKDYIISAAYPRKVGGPVAAYNLAEDAICLAEIGTAKRDLDLQARDDPTLQPILSQGTIVASGVHIPCKATQSAAVAPSNSSSLPPRLSSTIFPSDATASTSSSSSTSTTIPVVGLPSSSAPPSHKSSAAPPPKASTTAAPSPPTSTSEVTPAPPPPSSSVFASSSLFFSSSFFLA